MSNVAGVALLTAAAFLFVVAILLNSPALFYMSTAMIATIAAARWQAWMSTRKLEFKRRPLTATHVGEWVSVEIEVTSHATMRRPLIRVLDLLPERLFNETITPSTPVAPAFGSTVISRYKIRPDKRGVYRWSKVRIVGHDALGIVTMYRDYPANAVELVVYPSQIPVQFDFANAFGWGNSETEHGLGRGSGIEPRGTREYVFGDSMRYVHWRSSARSRSLIVKEFETGSHASAVFFIQDSKGSDVGEGARSTLELMCGHLAYILSRGLRQGVQVHFPALESISRTAVPQERELELLNILARLRAQSALTLSETMNQFQVDVQPGTALYVFASVQDPELPRTVESYIRKGHNVTVLVYDAKAFAPEKAKSPLLSAADASYVAKLRHAGASVRAMPLDGTSHELPRLQTQLTLKETLLMSGGSK